MHGYGLLVACHSAAAGLKFRCDGCQEQFGESTAPPEGMYV